MSSTLRNTLISALVGAVSVSAHGHISEVTVNGKSFKGFDPTAAPFGPQPDSVTWGNGAKDNGFVLSSAVNDPDVICHLDATNAALSVPVNAGDEVELTWNQWPESHSGPVIDYLADCGGDCSTVDKTSLKFFKIAEAGQTSLGAGGGQRGKWADDELLANNLKWTVKVPTSIKSGNYVLRHELIALHEAGTEGKAQLYPQCINLQVTSSGTESPEGVAGTALYTAKDEGIKYNIYNDETKPTYKIPGPALFAAGSGNAGNGGNSNQGGNNSNQGVNNNNQGGNNNNQGNSNNNQGKSNNNQSKSNNNQSKSNNNDGCNSKRRRRHARQVKV